MQNMQRLNGACCLSLEFYGRLECGSAYYCCLKKIGIEISRKIREWAFITIMLLKCLKNKEIKITPELNSGKC